MADDDTNGASDTPYRNQLTEKEQTDLRYLTEKFVVEHFSHHRPVALVSSGGTAADLDGVRSLENFSTGLRGAVAVEEFLKRGYAVIHLYRKGSMAPFARVLQQYLETGLDIDSLDKLFASEEEEELLETVLEEKDTFLNEPSHVYEVTKSVNKDDIRLKRSIIHSTRLQKAIRERNTAIEEGRILTVPFEYVEEYLGKLEICSKAIGMCESLAIVFLAAAVSDYYVPSSLRSKHKIQSSKENLTLTLSPVPKVVGLLRKDWAPKSFCVSFKLETDAAILRKKAERAVEKYGVHLVIGNLLPSRHEKVSLLGPDDQSEKRPESARDWEVKELVRSSTSHRDSLESSLIEHVVQNHFEYISYHYQDDGSGLRASTLAHKRLQEKKRELQRKDFQKRVKSLAIEGIGVLSALVLSYAINSVLQQRLKR